MENNKSIKDQVHELVDLKFHDLTAAFNDFVKDVGSDKNNPVVIRAFLFKQLAGIWVAIDRITEPIETLSQKEAPESPGHQILPKLNEGEMWDEAPKSAIDWLWQARKAGCSWGHSAMKQNKAWSDENYWLLSDVVLYFTQWRDTTEGHGYWDDVYNTLTQADY